jgi:aminopeptidase N
LQQRLAERLGVEALQQRYHHLPSGEGTLLDAASQARRRLKRRVLELLALIDSSGACQMATAMYQAATGMTERIAALDVLVRCHDADVGNILKVFRRDRADNPQALDKWFTVQATVPGETALERVLTLEADTAFTLRNPNRVQALLGAFVRGNPSGFHRVDGAGYRYLTERLTALDALNPQVAARLAMAFNGWQRLEPQRRDAARDALETLASREGLSRNLAEILDGVRTH